MSRVAIFVADGTEEVEALTVVDILRRAQMVCDVVSIMGKPEVTSSHGIAFKTDKVIEEINFDDYEMLILPGGMPGTLNLKANKILQEQLPLFAKDKAVAAICAAPTILSGLGLLEGKKAICFKGFQDVIEHEGAILVPDAKSVVDDNIITGQAMGATIPFALDIVTYLEGDETAQKVREAIAY